MQFTEFEKIFDLPEGLSKENIGFRAKSIYPAFLWETQFLESNTELSLDPRYSYLNSAQEIFCEIYANKEEFSLILKSKYFENVAKFKALNFLMTNLEIKKNVFGISDEKEFSVYDRSNNVLRSMVHLTSALVSGLKGVKTFPCDHFFKNKNSKYHHLSLQSFKILKEESGVGQVLDPLAGSYYVESRTEEIAKEAFNYLKEYLDEKNFFQSSVFKAWMASGAKKRRKQVLDKEVNIAGVNNFLNFNESILMSEIKEHSSELFILESIRSKVQEKNITAGVLHSENVSLKDFIKVQNIYHSFGIEVQKIAKVDFENLSFITSFKVDENKNEKFISLDLLESGDFTKLLQKFSENQEFKACL